MSLEQIEAGCDLCGFSFVATPTRTFLGFRRITCPNCHAKIIYPLTSGFRFTYWVIAIVMLLYAIIAYRSGGYAYPGGIGLAVLFAIYRDWTLRRRIGATDFSPAQHRLYQQAEALFPSTFACPACNSSIPSEAKFCSECGVELKPALSVSNAVEELSAEQKMAQFGITHDGSKYCFESYKYDRLQDAINYASRQRAKETPYKCR